MIKLLYITTGKYITWRDHQEYEIYKNMGQLLTVRKLHGMDSIIQLIVCGTKGDTDSIENGSCVSQSNLPYEFYRRNEILFPISIDEFLVVSDDEDHDD